MGSETRISRDPGIMGGKPCVAGTLVTVSMILNQLAAGHSIENVLEQYPYINRSDIFAALKYAADTIGNEVERVDNDTDRDGDTRIKNGADWLELVPRPGSGGEVRRMIEERPGSGVYWLDGWPSGWGIQHAGAKETMDYRVTAVDPPGGPFIGIGAELVTHSGRRVRVTKIGDGWSQIVIETEPV